jgi:hypothetical protein
MKFITIAVFVLLLNVSMAVVNELGIVDSAYEKTPTQEWFDVLGQDQLRDKEYVQTQVSGSTGFGFGHIWSTVKSIFYFILVVVWGVVAVPYTLTELGLSLTLASLISIPVYVAYLLGLAEWIGGRQSKGMY